MSDETERENLAEAEGWFVYWETTGTRAVNGEEREAARLLHIEYDRRGRERDEALGLLRELADWADLAYRDVARPDGAEMIADALALVERTSQGGET